jgi:microcystin-dependent protein
MIMMWSGTIATIPSGWLLCNGSSGTPDLRNRFIVGAFSDTTGVAYTTITGSNTQTGGSKDAITVSHTHTATDAGHTHVLQAQNQGASDSHFVAGVFANSFNGSANGNQTSQTGTANITVSTTGSSGTNANLVPYFALAFIMKA